MSPLALPDLPEEIGRRLVEDHLLNPKCFWLPGPLGATDFSWSGLVMEFLDSDPGARSSRVHPSAGAGPTGLTKRATNGA
jgi:hypothetical protein